MTPQDVEVSKGKAYIWGIPDDDHNCDAMGCSSIAHIIAIVPVVDNDGSATASAGAEREP
jgi:hypothetical protein